MQAAWLVNQQSTVIKQVFYHIIASSHAISGLKLSYNGLPPHVTLTFMLVLWPAAFLFHHLLLLRSQFICLKSKLDLYFIFELLQYRPHRPTSAIICVVSRN